MAFVTEAEVKKHLAAVMSKDVTELVSAWDEHVRRANPEGYNEVVTALAMRGYTLAQILAWDRGEAFNLDMAVFWALTYGAGLHGYDDKFIDKRDRREELKTVPVTIDGELVDPAGGKGSRVGWGLQSDANELITQAIRDRDRPDEETQW